MSSGEGEQKKPNFTGLPHKIVEQLARIDLSPHETRILMVIFRKTYGWQKDMDKIALTKFEIESGLPRREITRALKRLRDRRIVIIIRGKNATSMNSYRINENCGQWVKVIPKTVDNSSTARVTNDPSARVIHDPTC